MRHKPSHQRDEASVDLTPMLDIVFIMLIFFIVTATFLQEDGLDVTRPDTPPVEAPPSPTQPLRIVVSDTDQILIKMRPVDPRAVRANVERYVAENPEGSIVIQTSKHAKTGTVVLVMDQVKKVKGASMSIVASDE
ncbi:MAG: biopolymer transporter ExbD [Alphaproteobacteria bacterium]|nr:MAG: biopolymer transporter ExbD [Alphaproteobacteria bacterium]